MYRFFIRFAAISLMLVCMAVPAAAQQEVARWDRAEIVLESAVAYDNALYDVEEFEAVFTAPSGRERTVRGFWDGGRTWRVRFMPDEPGPWQWRTACSDEENSGLHRRSGSFECVRRAAGTGDIFTRGAVGTTPGSYTLAHADGTPFFWLGCTAWNGALKSTGDEWEEYLTRRAEAGYNVIQFVGTQWRGCDADSRGEVAFEGSGRIRVNPGFFQRIDRKLERVNAHGLVAAPVLLWALPFGQGRELSPGYYLPHNEAILLARYMVARWGGNHVVWVLGGDGRFVEDYEQRWKNIGRGVFGQAKHRGPATLHPHGLSWYGDDYDGEPWLDIVGYQSSHGVGKGTVSWINTGPPAGRWSRIAPRPVINMEPVYELIIPGATAGAVRRASWWSVLASPPAGVTYGTNGLWSWLRPGENILNHGSLGENDPTWRECLDLPAGAQVALLGRMMRSIEWWRLLPAKGLLAGQPGDENWENFVPVVATRERDLVLAYLPGPVRVRLRLPEGKKYSARWFDPVSGKWSPAELAPDGSSCLAARTPGEGDAVLVVEGE